MTVFRRLAPSEIERRRKASVEALRRREREEFDAWYQEQMDREYWRYGQCCAGCDFWNSQAGGTGECRGAGMVPGHEVLASVGIISWSGPVKPGYPLTSSDYWCGRFRDDFDWSALSADYLARIGADPQNKPQHSRERSDG